MISMSLLSLLFVITMLFILVAMFDLPVGNYLTSKNTAFLFLFLLLLFSFESYRFANKVNSCLSVSGTSKFEKVENNTNLSCYNKENTLIEYFSVEGVWE